MSWMMMVKPLSVFHVGEKIRNLKKWWKMDKIPYLTEVKPERLERDLKNVSKFFKKMRPAYESIFKDVQKMKAQERCFIAEALLTSIVHDSNMPTYIATGILERIKFNLLSGVPIKDFEEGRASAPSYTG